MSYDKETVIGVLKQCQEMLVENSYDWETVEEVISMAKEGKFNRPTLEEVWKEKCNKLGLADRQTFMFDFEGVTYISIIDPLDCITYWHPKEVVKL